MSTQNQSPLGPSNCSAPTSRFGVRLVVTLVLVWMISGPLPQFTAGVLTFEYQSRREGDRTAPAGSEPRNQPAEQAPARPEPSTRPARATSLSPAAEGEIIIVDEFKAPAAGGSHSRK